MNSPITPELSLYQLTQTLPHSPPSFTVKGHTFKGWVDNLIQFLLNQQIEATIWAKLPVHSRWWSTIESYQQKGLAKQVYSCNLSGSHSSKNQITPLILEANSQLKKEYFCLILSPQLCSLILVQEQISLREDSSPERLESSLFKLVYSFDDTVIQAILTATKRAIAITETTPTELLENSVLPFPFPTSIDSTLLTQLLHQHLAETESILEESKTLNSVNFLDLGDDFLETLIRQLSTPLTNMKTALRLLESKQHKKEPRQRYLDLLKGECDRQNFLVSGLQELVQLNQPIEQANLKVKLEEVVPRIVSTYQALAEEKGIILGYTIPQGFSPVACPEHWLKYIIHNLIHNSLKFTKANGRVSVQAYLKSQGVELSVSDTGIGIERSDLPKIFNCFYRGRNTLPDVTEGIGLGLGVVRHLIEQCGGKIEVTSQVGKGTIIRMLLPVEISS
ncbi:MAG: DICT sensory domain-containing protein [Cyanobacteria bacterium P01_G01_bin.49]